VFIECVNNNNTKYLRVVEGYVFDEGGIAKHGRRTVKNIGPLSRFDDGEPDYLTRLRDSFKNGKPLIDSLVPLIDGVTIKKTVTIEFDVENDCYCTPKNIGYFLLDALYDLLGIYNVFNLHKSRRGLEYDLNGMVKLLVFGRVLFPDSKFSTFENRGRYLFDVTKSDKRNHIYYALDALAETTEIVQNRMNLKIKKLVGRDTEVCYYDVTNYYFEIGENDLDEYAEDGVTIVKEGLRKRGVSKENRREPIVQMGLFIDDNGIPVGFRLFPGNHTDQTTLRPALEKTVAKMNFGRVIIVADGGLNSGFNIARILGDGNGYIVSKSTKKSDKTVKAWILDQEGYEWNETQTFKVKSQIRERKIKDENGKLMTITEKLVCFWSKRHYDRERHENEKFIEYLDSVIANPDKLKDKPKKIEKFLEKKVVDKSTGEVIDTSTHLSIDMEKVREYLDLMGYYTIMTSEIGKSDKEIISRYHGLSRIEDSFRVTKSALEGRPVYVRTEEHIKAHFLTCFISLTMIRLIQHRILKLRGKDTKSAERWETGLSAERIREALLSWQADALPKGYYRTTEVGKDLKEILDAFGIAADVKFPLESDLRQLKYSVDKAIIM
jgi:transposase